MSTKVPAHRTIAITLGYNPTAIVGFASFKEENVFMEGMVIAPEYVKKDDGSIEIRSLSLIPASRLNPNYKEKIK